MSTEYQPTNYTAPAYSHKFEVRVQQAIASAGATISYVLPSDTATAPVGTFTSTSYHPPLPCYGFPMVSLPKSDLRTLVSFMGHVRDLLDELEGDEVRDHQFLVSVITDDLATLDGLR